MTGMKGGTCFQTVLSWRKTVLWHQQTLSFTCGSFKRLTSMSRWRAVPGSSHSTLNLTPSATDNNNYTVHLISITCLILIPLSLFWAVSRKYTELLMRFTYLPVCRADRCGGSWRTEGRSWWNPHWGGGHPGKAPPAAATAQQKGHTGVKNKHLSPPWKWSGSYVRCFPKGCLWTN